MLEALGNLEPISMALIMIVVLLLLIALGLWVGLALMATGIFSMILFSDKLIGEALATTVWTSLSSWTLTSLPLFIWMGEILFRAKVADLLFQSLAPWVTRLPGRLLQLNVVGSGFFAAISGSSAATCATMGKITIPELRNRDYPEQIAVGSLLGSATLGLLIPPSIVMIVYGVAADVSITKLFMGGIFSGLLLASLFAIYIGVWSFLHSDEIPETDMKLSLNEMLRSAMGLLPVLTLILLVLGSIYSGFATATQAAAIGVIGALSLSFVNRTLTWAVFAEGVMEAVKTTTMIMLILAGSAFLSLAMAFTGIPEGLALWVTNIEMTPDVLLIALTLMYLVLGCFLDGISLIVLTTTVLLPVIEAAAIDLIWFGIYVVLVVEMSQITPPIGLNLFVMQNITGKSLGYLSRAAIPFFFIIVLAIFLIYIFPSIVTYLPSKI